jgi:hypothetical protein
MYRMSREKRNFKLLRRDRAATKIQLRYKRNKAKEIVRTLAQERYTKVYNSEYMHFGYIDKVNPFTLLWKCPPYLKRLLGMHILLS